MTPPALSQTIDRVDRELEALLPLASVRPERLHAAMRYAALAPGKRLRPALCLAAARAVGDDTCALGAACAVELVHCFSLIHDDLPAIDDDDLRRGRPTVHREFDEATAILAGDALFALAFQVLAASPAPPERVLRAVRRLTIAAGTAGLVGGEIVDVESEGRLVSPETLEFIHRAKTGALIGASCEIGAILAGGSEDQIEAIRGFGASVGLAFQIVDDVLNETSESVVLGKAAGSDRARAKATYPALYGVPESRRRAREAVDNALEAIKAWEADDLRALARFAIERLA